MSHTILNLFIFVTLAIHPLHVSILNMDLDQKNLKGSISLKLFSDDLVLALKGMHGEQLELDEDEISFDHGNLLSSYLREHLFLNINAEKLSFSLFDLDSVRQNQEATWLYYSFKLEEQIEELSVRNTIFFELFSDQKNMVMIGLGNTEKAFISTKRRDRKTIRF